MSQEAFDVYGDLDEFEAEAKDSIKSVKEENQKLAADVERLTAENTELKARQKSLEEECAKLKEGHTIAEFNFKQLHDVANMTNKRKERMIDELRKQKDDVVFRRKKRVVTSDKFVQATPSYRDKALQSEAPRSRSQAAQTDSDRAVNGFDLRLKLQNVKQETRKRERSQSKQETEPPKKRQNRGETSEGKRNGPARSREERKSNENVPIVPQVEKVPRKARSPRGSSKPKSLKKAPEEVLSPESPFKLPPMPSIDEPSARSFRPLEALWKESMAECTVSDDSSFLEMPQHRKFSNIMDFLDSMTSTPEKEGPSTPLKAQEGPSKVSADVIDESACDVQERLEEDGNLEKASTSSLLRSIFGEDISISNSQTVFKSPVKTPVKSPARTKPEVRPSVSPKKNKVDNVLENKQKSPPKKVKTEEGGEIRPKKSSKKAVKKAVAENVTAKETKVQEKGKGRSKKATKETKIEDKTEIHHTNPEERGEIQPKTVPNTSKTVEVVESRPKKSPKKKTEQNAESQGKLSPKKADKETLVEESAPEAPEKTPKILEVPGGTLKAPEEALKSPEEALKSPKRALETTEEPFESPKEALKTPVEAPPPLSETPNEPIPPEKETVPELHPQAVIPTLRIEVNHSAQVLAVDTPSPEIRLQIPPSPDKSFISPSINESYQAFNPANESNGLVKMSTPSNGKSPEPKQLIHQLNDGVSDTSNESNRKVIQMQNTRYEIEETEEEVVVKVHRKSKKRRRIIYQ